MSHSKTGPDHNDQSLGCEPDSVDWGKGNGLVPAIVQDADSGRVLMLGYMNQAALQATLRSRQVTFFSRSRQQLWTKGETSGNYLNVLSISADCDNDTLLVLARPTGPVCHRGTASCFSPAPDPGLAFLARLTEIIDQRRTADPATSYTARLLQDDIQQAAQKVGEEAVETVLAATCRDEDGFIDESADLLYHLLVLLARRDLKLADVARRLADRHAG